MTRDARRPCEGRGVILAALVLATAFAVSTAPATAAAQSVQPRGWTRVRIAKWALLGAATGFGAYALTHSSRADRDYGELRTFCTDDPHGCALDRGRYAAAAAEALYRSSVREDRRAQLGILGGQLTLLGSVALFVYDLRNARGPENIPYPGSALSRVPAGRRVALGASVRF